MSKYLLVGLGNSGAEYVGTRHNIGFEIADAMANKHEAAFKIDRLAEIAEFRWRGKQLIIIKPTTYMNLSGKAVKYWMDKERVEAENILVILDDIALPLNKIRLRPAGSDAGHNGLKSIQDSLATTNYPKLRFGIGNNYPKGGQSDFVLGKWTPQEQPLVSLKMTKCVSIIESFIIRGIAQTMSEWNKLDISL
ncbi:MAG: aminoacyl-tRNA hydrolase [Chitinophagaceae bacterium]